MAWQGRYAVFVVAFCAAASCGCTSMARRPFARHGHKAQMSEQQLSFARLNERNGASDSASKVYHKVLQRDPASKTANHRLGVIAAKGGKFDEAHAHFKKATSEGKPSAALLSDIGYTFYLEDRLDEAEQALRAALTADGKYAAAHNNLGLVLGQQGRIDEALVAFQATGTEAQAHANMGYVHAHRLEFAEAQSHYSRALSLDNDLRPAAEAMIQIARRQPPRGVRPMPPAASETRLASYRTESSGASSAPSSKPPRDAQASASAQPSVGSDTEDAAGLAGVGSLLPEARPEASRTASRLSAERPATTNEVPWSSLKSPTPSTAAASPMRVRNRLRIKNGKGQGPQATLSMAGVESPSGSAHVASIQTKPRPRRRSILTVKRRRSEQEGATETKQAQVEQTVPSNERPEMQAGSVRPDIFSWGAESTSSLPRMVALPIPEGMAMTPTPAPSPASPGLPSTAAAPTLPVSTDARDEIHVLNVHSQPRVFSWTTPVESAAPPEGVRSNSLATRVVGESASDTAQHEDEAGAAALVQEHRKRRRVVVVRTSRPTSEAESGGFAEASDSASGGG